MLTSKSPRRASITALAVLFAAVATGIGSCDKTCKSYELRGAVNRWSGEAIKEMPAVVRLGYQYHATTQPDQVVVYREVNELFTATTDGAGRFVIHRTAPAAFGSVDEKTVKVSLVYGAQKLGDVALDPARVRSFNDEGVCGLEASFILKRPQRRDDRGFQQRRIEHEVRLGKEQGRETYVDGVGR